MPRRKAKAKKDSKKNHKMTRRTVLKMGAAAGAVTILSSDYLDIKEVERVCPGIGNRAGNMPEEPDNESAASSLR